MTPMVAPLGRFPRTRLRRPRLGAWSRRLVAETTLSVDDLILPLFVCDGDDRREAVDSMPGVERFSCDRLGEILAAVAEVGLPAVALFPCVDDALKSPGAEEAHNPDNLVCRAIRAVKLCAPGVGIIADVALDPFNSDGHDGLVRAGEVVNDDTVAVLCRQAIVQAAAGADVVGPSDMMDGRIGAIRDALDRAGHQRVLIMAYGAKYASAFYGPFREAVGSGACLAGDKKTYQMDPANRREALREVALDIDEGADMIVIKPGLPCLDVLAAVKERFGVPTLAYHVSGEYAMLRAAAERGWIDYPATLMESLTALKRAGADAILTYAALDAARLLRRG